MFDFVQNHKRLAQLILALLVLPFAFFGVESYTRATRGADAVALVDGSPISIREFSDELRRQQDRVRQILGPNADVAAFDSPELRLAIVESLISQRLLLNEVASANLAASRDSVVAAIMAAPEFQEGGKFSAERYANYLRAVGLSDEGNVQKLRVELPAGRLTGAVVASAIEPRAVAERMAAIEAEKREVAEAVISVEPYAARAKPDEAAIKAYYEANLALYKQPERIRADYVVYSAEALGASEPPTEDEIKAAYAAKIAEYTVPEQRRASHILLPTREEAEKVLAEVRRNPQQFAEIAKKRSQDTGSAANGGDLGMNPRGGLASKALDDAVFALAPNAIGDVVQSEFGFHVVKLNAIQPGSVKPLEAVRKDIASGLARQKAAKQFADGAETFNNLAYEQSDSLKPVADRFKLKIQTSGWFTREGPGPDAGPLANPKLVAALFSPDSIKQRRNTDAIEVSPGVLVAARVAEHQPEAQRPLDEVKADVAKRLAAREGAAQARKDGEAKLAELAKGGDAGLAWSAAKTVSRREAQGFPPIAVQRVMAADASKLPAYVGVDRGEQGYALYRIAKVIPGDVAATLKEVQARLDRDNGTQQLEAYLASLRARANVEINAKNLEAKAQP